MKDCVIIDFDNEYVIMELPEIKGTKLLTGIDRMELINALGPLSHDDYMKLCQCSICSVNFIKNRIATYKAISYTKNTVYNESLLQEKSSFTCEELAKHYTQFMSILLQ